MHGNRHLEFCWEGKALCFQRTQGGEIHRLSFFSPSSSQKERNLNKSRRLPVKSRATHEDDEWQKPDDVTQHTASDSAGGLLE